MKLNIQQFNNTRQLIQAVLLLCPLLILSCAKQEDKNYNPADNGKVKVRISKTTFDDEINLKSGNTHFADYPLTQTQTTSIDFNADYYPSASLTPLPSDPTSLDPNEDPNLNLNLNLNPSPSTKATVSQPLKKDVKYKVAVFAPDGTYVTEKNYTYQNEEAEGDIC